MLYSWNRNRFPIAPTVKLNKHDAHHKNHNFLILSINDIPHDTGTKCSWSTCLNFQVNSGTFKN